MKLLVKIDSQEKTVEITEENGHYVMTIDGKERVVDCRSAGHRDYLSLIIDNRSHLVESAPVNFEEGTYYANIYGRRYDVDVLDERLVATREAAAVVKDTGPYVISSPMPGLIVDVRVEVGDAVAAGATLVIMEAMKMRNELTSEVAGAVRAIHAKKGDAVESQVALIEIERSE